MVGGGFDIFESIMVEGGGRVSNLDSSCSKLAPMSDTDGVWWKFDYEHFFIFFIQQNVHPFTPRERLKRETKHLARTALVKVSIVEIVFCRKN